MKIYLVGGAVRDQLLGIQPKDRDWVVVGATPEEMLEAGFNRADQEFPVFIHPETGEEYALARVEHKTGCGYKGFNIYAGPDVTLEQDLKRRDFTINAMVQDKSGAIIDPFGGRKDLENRKIRHVSSAFTEDPLRLLRAARFAARFHRYGFHIAQDTQQLMVEMAESGELESLTSFRIWSEMSRALAEPNPDIFFQILHTTGALKDIFPEFEFCMDQNTQSHDSVFPILQDLSKSAKKTDDPTKRWAALLYGLYLCNHGIEFEATLKRYNPPSSYSYPVRNIVDLHETLKRGSNLDAESIYAMFEHHGAIRNPEVFMDILQFAKSLPAMDSRMITRLEAGLEAIQKVKAKPLIESGLKGHALGVALKEAKILSIEKSAGELT